jgi:hypothetical protein
VASHDSAELTAEDFIAHVSGASQADVDPLEHVAARAAEIAAFATALRDAPRGSWPEHDLVTLARLYAVLAEQTDRQNTQAVAAAASWLQARTTADTQALLDALAAVDRAFRGLVLDADELKMLRGSSSQKFEAKRVVAALALRCGALGFKKCQAPLTVANASTLDAAVNSLKAATQRYRSSE